MLGRRLALLLTAVILLGALGRAAAEDLPDSVAFFEKRIRPVLVERCQECHAEETDDSGGLVLDSAEGWQIGGDSGPAIVPGDPEASRLLSVIAYTDPELEMPPDGKLSAAVIEDFRRWIVAGATDPRTDGAPRPRRSTAELDWEGAREHWAYRPLQDPAVPELAHGSDDPHSATVPAHDAIDRFVLQRLHEAGIEPNEVLDRRALIRRLTFDLHGLPPTAAEIDHFLADRSPDAYSRLVDRLLASPRFAERFGRHWLDVARYAESVTLRGLVLPEAWRFRDYVIESLAEDRPWNEVLREHIAGDLMTAGSVRERQRQQIGVAFLCMGNTNLEEQDKNQLDMDHIDEQLETIGRALLAQTIGCARCHDHKFDPIPTSDYYALAGILRGSDAMAHDNVSRWIENPLPLDAEQQTRFDAAERELSELESELAALRQRLSESGQAANGKIDPDDLPGVVVDDVQARKVGQWQASTHTRPFVGAGYVHDGNEQRGEKTITFEPKILPPGRYEVRISYTPGSNRATNAPVTVFSADGERTIHVDQRKRPPVEGLWLSLGEYRFEENGQAYVMISNEGVDGHVIADALQFLPEGESAAPPSDPDADRQRAEWLARQAELEKQRSALRSTLAQRPRSLGLQPREPFDDLPIHIRGSVHTLGAIAPRGVLKVVPSSESFQLPPDQCGRLQLADWITRDDHPLTPRVLANRVWQWLLGEGLVRTPDNFGLTGQSPSHPELLDWLTLRLIEDGWSIQRLVRRIVHSRTYQLASHVEADDPRSVSDPENRLLWRGHRKPVEAESLRDAALMISGQLDLRMFGSEIRPGTTADYGYEYEGVRRSVYIPVLRNALPEIFETFNFANPSFVTGRRVRGIVPQQALLMMNHPWFRGRAEAAAERLVQLDRDDAQRIETAFLWTLGRPPTESEFHAAAAFLDQIPSDQSAVARDVDAYTQLFHSLFATAEFRFVD